jgi:hypothetical protein
MQLEIHIVSIVNLKSHIFSTIKLAVCKIKRIQNSLWEAEEALVDKSYRHFINNISGCNLLKYLMVFPEYELASFSCSLPSSPDLDVSSLLLSW